MSELRRIMITVPDTLLQEVDGMVALEKGGRSRSEFVREALHRFLEDRKRREFRGGPDENRLPRDGQDQFTAS